MAQRFLGAKHIFQSMKVGSMTDFFEIFQRHGQAADLKPVGYKVSGLLT